MKRFPKLSNEEHLKIDSYKFMPEPDITAYELALITDALLLERVKPNALLKTIIKKWPLPDICRHIMKRTTDVDYDFETEIRESIKAYFEKVRPTEKDAWWAESINHTVINTWLRED